VIGNGGEIRHFREGPQKITAPVVELTASSVIFAAISGVSTTSLRESSTSRYDSPDGTYSDLAVLSAASSSSRKPSIFALLRKNLLDASIAVHTSNLGMRLFDFGFSFNFKHFNNLKF
jgi:hypothetical protein